MTIDEIRKEVQALDDSDKGLLAGELLESMKPSEYWVSDEEVHERARQLESGEVEGITFDELRRRLGR